MSTLVVSRVPVVAISAWPRQNSQVSLSHSEKGCLRLTFVTSDPDIPTELIFVTNITNYIFGEKLSCGEILGNFATIYALSCGKKLSPKSTFVEKNDK